MWLLGIAVTAMRRSSNEARASGANETLARRLTNSQSCPEAAIAERTSNNGPVTIDCAARRRVSARDMTLACHLPRATASIAFLWTPHPTVIAWGGTWQIAAHVCILKQILQTRW